LLKILTIRQTITDEAILLKTTENIREPLFFSKSMVSMSYLSQFFRNAPELRHKILKHDQMGWYQN